MGTFLGGEKKKKREEGELKGVVCNSASEWP